MLHGDRAGAINCLAAHPHLPILATSGLEDDAKVWAPTGEYSPIADGTPKKKKVDSVIERNQERSPPPTYLYSNSIIDMLTSLLNQDPTALQNLDDDDDDDDDDDADAIDASSRSNHPTSGTTPATSSQQSTSSPSSNRASTRTNTTRIPWSLMRLIPVILGRRRRSSVQEQEDTSENEYDVEEAEDDVNAGGVDEEEEEEDEDDQDEENQNEENQDADEDEFAECHDSNEPSMARNDVMALQQALEEDDEDVEEALCRELQQYRACNGTEEEEEDGEDEDEEEGGDVWVDCMDDQESLDCCPGKACDQVVDI
jgi:hypothetical protein